MYDYIICDTHCDTLSEAFDNNLSLEKNNIHIDINRMKLYKKYTQFFAIFSSPEYYSFPMDRVINIVNHLKKQLKNNNFVNLCTSYDELKKSHTKYNAFLSLEGGEAINCIDDLSKLYDIGIRMISPTWNNDNQLGGGTLGKNIGLSKLGKDIVKKLNSLNMILDLSHSGERTFFEAMELYEKPIVLSHSNSYSVCKNPRNITDTQFEMIVENNGVVGINFCPIFLTNSFDADIYDIIKHIEHFLNMGGENNICIGSDFDGVDYLPTGINGIECMYKIFNELKKRGYNDKLLQKIAYKNIYRVISFCL